MRTTQVFKAEVLCVRLDAARAKIVYENCAALGIGGPELVRRLIDGLVVAGNVPAKMPPMPRRIGDGVIGWKAEDIAKWLAEASAPADPPKAAEVA